MPRFFSKYKNFLFVLVPFGFLWAIKPLMPSWFFIPPKSCLGGCGSIEGMIPPGASTWNGSLSQDITVTFDVEGLYGYQCTPHAMMAMVGVIEVGKNKSNLESVKATAQKIKATFVMNQERFDSYLSQL